MSARRTNAASPVASSAWWRSMAEATALGSPQRRASTPPTRAWSKPILPRSRLMRSSGVRAEALARGVPHRGALQEVEGPHPDGQRRDGLGGEQVDRLEDGLDAPAR